MQEEQQIKIPDIGGATAVEVIEILVKVGDEISVDTPLITLESDKASMEIPAQQAGKIKSIAVKIGDKVSEGDVILTVESKEGINKKAQPTENEHDKSTESPPTSMSNAPVANSTESTQPEVITIPDIGGAVDVDVIEIMVKVGDSIVKDQALLTLEGDKATMDIPSPLAGVVESITVKIGDKVAQNTPILTLKVAAMEGNDKRQEQPPSEPKIEKKPESDSAAAKIEMPVKQSSIANPDIAAGPAVRRLAREFGVNLHDVRGSGRKSRITKEDLQSYIKNKLAQAQSRQGFALPEAPTIDFRQFGAVEIKPLNKIKRLTGANVHRSWISIPHVTQFDEADITALEDFRQSENRNVNQDFKLTILAFVTRVVAKALQIYPQFNASLDSSLENLIYKQYVNIGIAVETPNGLVVPVIKNVDKLSIADIAKEMTRLSQKAREKGLMPADMTGGCFTISSLGGIGGTAFTPIVNSPEVAILGLSRSIIKPVYQDNNFQPRLMLPLSLSYDHRVIDGAEAARFVRYLAEALADIRKILL